MNWLKYLWSDLQALFGFGYHPGYNSSADAAKAFWMPQAYASEQNAKQTMQTNIMNRENIMMQNQWNVEQWERENAYNNPVNQMQRMRAAGLNPGLMYGGSGSIAASASSPMMQGARDVAPQLAGADNLFGNLMSLMSLRSQIDKTEAETQSIRDSNARENDKHGLNLEVLAKTVDKLNSSISLESSQVALNQALTGESKKRSNKLQQEWERDNATLSDYLRQFKAEADISEENSRKIADLLQKTIDSAEASAKYNYVASQELPKMTAIARKNAQSNLISASASKLSAISQERERAATFAQRMKNMKAEVTKLLADAAKSNAETKTIDMERLGRIITQYTDIVQGFIGNYTDWLTAMSHYQ